MSSLVTCKNCNVQYAASAGKCPACGDEYAPSHEELVRIAFEDAVQLLKQGVHIKRVQHLVATQHNLDDESIASIMNAAGLQERQLSKKHGQYIATSGCLLLMVALVVLVVTGGFLIATGCLMVGGAMFIAGIIQSWTGWRVAGSDTD